MQQCLHSRLTKLGLSVRLAVFCVAIAVAAPAPASDEASDPPPWLKWGENYPDWIEPIEPFELIDNIYYVGTRGLGSYLFTSEQGHILLDGGLPQNAKLIAQNISDLGFALQDIKILINSHAHFDHSGGLAELKSLTGAKLLSSSEDKPSLQSGTYAGSDNPYFTAPPVTVDQELSDGELVTLGDISLKAHITPGHSPGCTSWTTDVPYNDANLQVLLFCSASVAANSLVKPPQYAGIVDDYRRTFEITRDWRPDIFLANHPFLFDMDRKRAAINQPQAVNPFIDRETFPILIKQLEIDFEQKLKQQQAEK